VQDIGISVAAAVTLFLGSVLLIGGAVWLCESIEVPEKKEDEIESDTSYMSGPRGCGVWGLTWIKVPAGVSQHLYSK